MTPSDLRDRPLTRRCALAGLGGVGVAAVLAACSSGSGDDAADAGTSAAAPTSAAETPTSSSSSASAPASSSSASSGGDAIAALSDVPVGGTGSGQSGGDTVLLSQPSAGTVEGFSPICPHQGGQVQPDGDKFRCSLHFSEFDLDGKVTKGPATKDLTPVTVAVSGDDIVAG
jgi:cytochrome b6-f complex iron-sulfur subunit